MDVDYYQIANIKMIGNNFSLGLMQFVLDLPYDFASEACRMRCQILLRQKMDITVTKLYQFPDVDLPNLVKKGSIFFFWF